MQQNYNKNNKSLALLGQSKWKHALKFTLLLIGFVMSFGMMVAYAQEPTGGLYMHKDWQPDLQACPDGSCGYIRLETFVTGEKMIIESHKPTDIVLVLDVSGSMTTAMPTSYRYTALPSTAYSYNSYGNNTYYYLHTDGNYYPVQRQNQWISGIFNPRYYYRLRYQVGNTWYYLSGTGTTTTAPTNVQDGNTIIWTGVLYTRQTINQNRLEALQEAVCNFVDNIAEDATTNNVDHCISIVKYAMNTYYGSESSLEEGNHTGVLYNGSTNNNYNYTEVVVNRGNPRTNANDIKNAVNSLTAGGATAADYGMSKARYLLASIPANEFEQRSKVVVMFTDGEPTYESDFQTQVATNTIRNAHDLKHSWTNPNNNIEYQFDAKVYTIGVFNNPSNQVLNYMAYTSSNYPDAQSMTNTGQATPDVNYTYTAESSGSLSEIFETIAGESGASSYDLGSETVVQDVISPNFQLEIPDGQTAGTVIKAYAPKCIGKSGNNFVFEEELEGRLQMGTDDEGNQGVVIGGSENRLPDGVVNYNARTKTITFTNFNFAAMYVAQKINNDGTPYIDPTTHQHVFIGRKLVMLIPLEVEEGTWGDDMVTNGPLSIIQPNGDILNPLYFNVPTANVIGHVWTEIVTTKPEGFDPMDIDSPEDLAWFISVVNGRAGYSVNSQQTSNPGTNAKLTADIDMSAHNWVSIGEGTDGYTGTFDGNGHVVTGLKNNATKYYKLNDRAMVYPGMFSNVKGTVKNVFVLDAEFRAKNHVLKPEDEFMTFIHFGIIADTLSTNGAIYNCEAAGRLMTNTKLDNVDRDSQIILGGLVGFNNGGTIHSTMAMAELTGYTMGGMIGENKGSFTNGFTNGIYNYIGTSEQAKPIGGIAAINLTASNITNCYVRFSRESSGLNKTTGFNQVVGNGSYTAASCFTPSLVEQGQEILTVNTAWNNTIPEAGGSTSYYTNTRNQSRVREDRSNDNMVGGEWQNKGEGEDAYKVLNGGTPMLTKLNQGAGSKTPWKRTTAIGNNYHFASSPDGGNINGDYPVLMIEGFTCLASTDGITIDYAASLDEMLERHNTGNMNVNSTTYSKTQAEAIYGGAINLYANESNVTKSTISVTNEDDETISTMVYIDENISLLQDENSKITAYTGQTIKDFGSDYDTDGNRWHNVSSSLTGSKFGWSYGEEGEVLHSSDPNPCGWILPTDNDDESIFPSDVRSTSPLDFYCFFEPQYHWINFRRNGQSHWHMDLINDAVSYDEPTNHAKIDYYYNYKDEDEEEFTEVHDNETSFIPGKGYLMALYTEYFANRHLWNDNNDGSKNGQFVQNRGTLNNGEITIPVTYTAANEWTGLAGYNLLGNPYQSYLDFATFAAVNSDLWNNDANAMTYAVYDPTLNIYAQATAAGTASQGSYAATGDINMHQGFFICVKKSGTATFNNTMRSNTPAAGTQFRGERLNYPVINLIVTDSEGNNDVAVLEVGRPENGGGEKLRVGSATGRISLRHDNTDFGILFRDMNEGSQPLRFETQEDGTFTLSWNTANANFSSLTLVDNITGVNYDMLAHDSYEFEGRASDYKSRFKILIGEFTDVEENEETVTNNFAFFDGSEWVVNGQGQLTVTDVMGRMVYTDNLTNDQNHVSLNGLSQGVYLMQVRNASGAMVQKIVVR